MPRLERPAPSVFNALLDPLGQRTAQRRTRRHEDPQAVAQMTEADIDALMQNSGLIRHRGKLTAIVTNARAYGAMQANGEDFSRFVWSFVGGQPQINHFAALNMVPAQTPASLALSKALKKRGFKFVGSTICYSFMQACGLVNDHLTDCFCHPANQPL